MSEASNDIERRDPGTLRHYAGNARTHFKKQVRQIADSIERFGFTNPALVADCTHIAGQARPWTAVGSGFLIGVDGRNTLLSSSGART